MEVVRRILKRSSKPTITSVVENSRWVAARRVRYLGRYFPHYRFRIITMQDFVTRWNVGRLRGEPVYFSSWRIVHRLLKEQQIDVSLSDWACWMASVTSHSTIGGGLDPYNPIPGRQPEEALHLAVELLRRFRVVTVNSLILHELLAPNLPELFYCPNGVDEVFFHPPNERTFDPCRIRLGWVGKIRGPKNYDTLKEAFDRLEQQGFCPRTVAIPKSMATGKFLSAKAMRSFYHDIDFYVCASWNEGTPNPALEAAACGVPIVTTRVGNMRELIDNGKNGFFIEPTVESILRTFEGVKRLKVADYHEMSQRIRSAVVNDWAWPKQAAMYEPAFERLLARAMPPCQTFTS